MKTTFGLDAQELVLCTPRPSGTIHHNDKGCQYVSLAYTQRLNETGLLASTVTASMTPRWWRVHILVKINTHSARESGGKFPCATRPRLQQNCTDTAEAEWEKKAPNQHKLL